MSIFITSCLLFLANSLLLLFKFIASHVLSKTSLHREDDFSVSELTESNYVNKVEEKDGSFSFKFQYQICNDKDTLVTVMEENESTMTSSDMNKYQFWSENDVGGVMEQAKAMDFQVHESFMELEEYCNFDGDNDIRFLSAEDFQKTTMEAIAEEKSDDDQVLSALNMMPLKKQFSEEEKFISVCSEISSVSFSDFDSDTEQSSDGYSVRDFIIDSDWGSSFSDGYFGDCEHDSEIRETIVNNRNKLVEGKHELFLERREGEEENDDDIHVEKKKHISYAEKNIREVYSNETTLKVEVQSNKRETRQRLVQFEEESKNEEVSFVKNGSTARLDNSGEADLEPEPETLDRDKVGKTEEESSNNDSCNSVYVSYEQQHTIDNHDTERKKLELEEEKSKETFTLDLDEDEFDEIWEHEDLIMQLKMELKKVRAIGLPTILEESESPRAIEDSKSFKNDEKLLHEDPMDELHKLYKCYKEGMRKFDILNYQKMYATGFLQLRDPLELNKTQKPMFSTIISRLSRSFLPFSNKKSNCDPSEKYIQELRCDLETVYVGQICLSWEFLRWQYEKLHKLTDSDSFISHQYNNVAEEFQQFKVTLQRFIENESFQGPRLTNYVKQRCILRNLLQLPAIKEDCLKDKMDKGKEEDVMTREMLEDIMEEAMRIFWEFVKAEKYETPRFLKGLAENHVELQDPSDYEFMVDVQASLHKKEKKLKNLLKAGNCIVKMLKRRQEGRSNQDLFFSQVDLKIVSRVLRMSRITSDQLIWCQKKLSKISFSGRKIHREPSFLLFPC